MPVKGDWIQVLDPKFGWFDARVVAERGGESNREVKIHYNGWSKSTDVWLVATSERIKAEDEELSEEEEYDWGSKDGHLCDDQYEVAKILRNKSVPVLMYKVAWVGLNKDGETQRSDYILNSLCHR